MILDRAMANLLATSAVFALLGTTSIASAQVDIPPTAAPEAPMCMNFSDMDFTLNGDAKWSTDCRLELTSEDPELSGSAFAAITFDDTVNYPFEAYYEYDITDTVIDGTSVGGIADGIAFLVHIDPQGVNALNDAGGALGETSVLNGMILLVLARLFNMRCLSSRSRRPRKKSTRLPPQSVLWTHWAAMTILAFFLGASLKIGRTKSCPNNRSSLFLTENLS